MQFYVTMVVRDSIVVNGDARLRQLLGSQHQQPTESDPLPTSGPLAGKRSGCFVLELETSEEMNGLFGIGADDHGAAVAPPAPPADRTRATHR